MPALQTEDLTVQIPTGWDARTSRRAATVVDGSTRSRSAVPDRDVVQIHSASFALPEDRGDFGSGAVELMRTQDVFVALIEYAPRDDPQAAFAASGVPGPLSIADFNENALQRPQAGQVGVQRFFHVGRRRFCLYVVLGHRVMALRKLGVINDMLSTLTIS